MKRIRGIYIAKQIRIAYNLTTAIMKLKFKRFGRDGLTAKLKNRVRFVFTFQANVNQIEMRERQGVVYKRYRGALREFFDSCMWWLMSEKVMQKTRYFNYLITFMQRRMRDKCVTIDAKVEVVRLAWDKYLQIWSQKAVFFSDEGMKLILSQVRNVKEEVITFLLKSYIRQCKKRHALAFMEWRIHFSQARRLNDAGCQMSIQDIEEIISDRVAYAERESTALLSTFDLKDDTVILGNFCSVIKPKANYKLSSSNESY